MKKKTEKKFNIYSLIVYLGVLLIIMLDIIDGTWGSSVGILSAFIIIYFVMADEQAKQNIRNNLLFKRG